MNHIPPPRVLGSLPEEMDLLSTWQQAKELLTTDDPQKWLEGEKKLVYCRELIGVATDYMPRYDALRDAAIKGPKEDI